MRSGSKFVAAGLVLVSGVLMAAPISVGPATKSTLTATFKQEGAAVESESGGPSQGQTTRRPNF